MIRSAKIISVVFVRLLNKPQVEIVTRRLRDLIVGKIIVKAQLIRAGLTPENSPRRFTSPLKGGALRRSRGAANMSSRLSRTEGDKESHKSDSKCLN